MKILVILFLISLVAGQLGGISPFPGVVIYIHDILLSILVLFYGRKMKHAKLIVPIAIFISAGLLSLFANYARFPLPELLTGSLYLVRWTLYAALYFIVIQDKRYVRMWIDGLYSVGVGFGLIGLMQFFLYPDLRNLMYLGWDPHYYRLFSTLLDPNFVGIILVLTLLLGFGILTKKNRTIVIGGQLISFVALLLTYSRSSFLALAAAIIVWAGMQKRWKFFIVLAAFGGLVLILPHGSTLSLLRSDSAFARIGNWQESIALITKAPMFGHGFDTLRYISGDMASRAAAGVDSSLLFVLSTTGIVGFTAYLFLLISMIRQGKRYTFYVASFAALLVHSLFVNSLFYPWVMIWMWILAGAVTYDT